MFQPYIEMSWFLAKYTILFASLPQVITISQNIFYHWCINCSYFSRCLLLCKHMLTLLLQSLHCPHSRFPVKFIQFSLGTAQKPGDFFSLPAGTAVRFSSSGRTCLPSICCTQSSCKAFTPRIPTSASAPLWTCRCQKIRSMQFYSSFASLPSAFFLHSLQNRKRTFIISATRGSCQKNCQRDTNRL